MKLFKGIKKNIKVLDNKVADLFTRYNKLHREQEIFNNRTEMLVEYITQDKIEHKCSNCKYINTKHMRYGFITLHNCFVAKKHIQEPYNTKCDAFKPKLYLCIDALKEGLKRMPEPKLENPYNFRLINEEPVEETTYGPDKEDK